MATRSADSIEVGIYRQILLWPMILKQPVGGRAFSSESLDSFEHNGEERVRQFDRWIESLTSSTVGRNGVKVKSPWKPHETLPVAITPSDDFNQGGTSSDPTFEEMIYFHPHVRDFLYGDGDPMAGKDRPLYRYAREDIKAVAIELAGRPQVAANVLLQVDRVELYLCKPTTAILVLEVSLPKTSDRVLCLADAMALQSQLREVYPPFFVPADGSSPELPGNCPKRVAWLASCDVSQPPLAESNFTAGREHFASFTCRGAEPPVAEHWRWLLEAYRPLERAGGDGYCYQQIVDDRIPGMTFLGVDDPRAISEGDFDRLTFCDLADSALYPFSAEFLQASRARYCYDRFWRSTPDHDTEGRKFETRYLCSGFQFVAVGPHKDWFFANIIASHFRRHYFRMGFVLHYHRAVLLKFADELAESLNHLRTVRRDREFADGRFADAVSLIQEQFVKFCNRGWFEEVSNQLQGREMFAWWRDLLGCDELFEQVNRNSQQLYSMLNERETREMSRRQEQMNYLMVVVAVASLVAAIAQVAVAIR